MIHDMTGSDAGAKRMPSSLLITTSNAIHTWASGTLHKRITSATGGILASKAINISTVAIAGSQVIVLEPYDSDKDMS